jgi:hypothetical protein
MTVDAFALPSIDGHQQVNKQIENQKDNAQAL